MPISIYVKPNGNAYINGVSETTNHTTSIYARDNTYNYIKKSLFDSRVLDINEKEVNRLENILGVYFPDNILSVDFNKSIAYYKTLVNRDYAQNSENNTNSVDEGKYSFGDEDEQLLNDLDLILDNEDGHYSAQKYAYGKKVKHRVNSIEKYAEGEAEDSLVNAGGKRAERADERCGTA